MSELYSREHLKKIEKRRKTTIIVGISAPIFAFLLVVASCFFVKQSSLTAIKIADGIILVLSAWSSFYLLGSRRTELNNKIEHLADMLNVNRKTVSCEIGRIGEPKTITFDVFAYEIFDRSGSLSLYLEFEQEQLPFAVGDTVDFAVVNNFIVAYEVKR